MIVPRLHEIDWQKRSVAVQRSRDKVRRWCGNSAVPDKSRTRAEFLRRSFPSTASAMNGFQLRMPTCTGMPSSRSRSWPCFRVISRERRAANQSITMLHLFDNMRRQRTASGDLQQEFRHFLDGIGAAVGEQQDGTRFGFGGGHHRVLLYSPLPVVIPREARDLHFRLTNYRFLVAALLGMTRGLRLFKLPQEFCQRFHVLDRSLRQNAVAKIKDVSRPPCRAAQNILRPRFQFLPIREQQHRIQISLNRTFEAKLRQPSSSGMRQSRPITSAPVSCIEGSRVALSVPK